MARKFNGFQVLKLRTKQLKWSKIENSENKVKTDCIIMYYIITTLQFSLGFSYIIPKMYVVSIKIPNVYIVIV